MEGKEKENKKQVEKKKWHRLKRECFSTSHHLQKAKAETELFKRYSRNRSKGSGHDFKHEDADSCVPVSTCIPANNVKDTLACLF